LDRGNRKHWKNINNTKRLLAKGSIQNCPKREDQSHCVVIRQQKCTPRWCENQRGQLHCCHTQTTINAKKVAGKVEEYAIEGNSWIAMAKLHLPENFATAEGDKIAMRLATFVCVGQDGIQAAPTKIKEERRCEAVADILRASCVGTNIKIKYLQGDAEIEGVAVKQNEGKWIVLLNNNKQFLVDPIALQDPSKIKIKYLQGNAEIEGVAVKCQTK
jgi:hypothetical protein